MDPSPGNERTLVVEDDILAQGFTQVPNIILRSRTLSRDAKLLYGILLSYAWQRGSCFPGYDTLTEDLQCGRSQLSKWIQELKSGGYLDVTRRGQGKTSIYVLKKIQKSHFETTRSPNPGLPVVPTSGLEEYSGKEDSEGEDDSNIRMVPTSKSDVDNRGPTRERARPRPAPLETHVAIAQEHLYETLKSSAAPSPNGVTRSSYGPERQRIVDYIADFAREFNDAAPAKSSVTRAVNLFRRSGLELEDFCEQLYAARAVVKERTAAIKTTTTEPGKPFATKRKMGYFFAVLEDTLGLRGPTRTAGDD